MLALRLALSIGLLAVAVCPPHCSAQERKQGPSKIDKFVTVYGAKIHYVEAGNGAPLILVHGLADSVEDRKSTRLNSSHLVISYAVFCLKKKKNKLPSTTLPTL